MAVVLPLERLTSVAHLRIANPQFPARRVNCLNKSVFWADRVSIAPMDLIPTVVSDSEMM